MCVACPTRSDPSAPSAPAATGTQILLSGELLPGRADATAVVGTTLAAKAGGHGHLRIAADLHRPVPTVNRSPRAARVPTDLEWIRSRANQRAFRIDPDILNWIIP
ncbi:MAG TPA: hypothetical protein VI248_20160 [Kineosporiaceae bacterium]